MAKVLQVQEVPIIQVSTMCFPIYAGPNFGKTLDKKSCTSRDHTNRPQIFQEKRVNLFLHSCWNKYSFMKMLTFC